MHRFSRVLILPALCLIVTGFCASPSNAQETLSEEEKAERLEYARAYLEVVPPSQMIRQMASSVTRRLPEKNQDEVREFLDTEMDMARIEAINLQLLTEQFTAEELKAMADFYKSDVGRSIHRKTPEYSMQLFHQVFPVMLRAVQEHIRKKNGDPALEAGSDI